LDSAASTLTVHLNSTGVDDGDRSGVGYRGRGAIGPKLVA